MFGAFWSIYRFILLGSIMIQAGIFVGAYLALLSLAGMLALSATLIASNYLLLKAGEKIGSLATLLIGVPFVLATGYFLYHMALLPATTTYLVNNPVAGLIGLGILYATGALGIAFGILGFSLMGGLKLLQWLDPAEEHHSAPRYHNVPNCLAPHQLPHNVRPSNNVVYDQLGRPIPNPNAAPNNANDLDSHIDRLLGNEPDQPYPPQLSNNNPTTARPRP